MKVIYGSERYLLKREIRAFKKLAEASGDYELCGEWSQEVADKALPGFFDTFVHVSLFDAKPLVQQDVAVDLTANILVSLQVSPTAAQSKELTARGYELLCFNKVSGYSVEEYISAFVTKHRMRITQDACKALIKRTGYFEDESVCLDNIFNELRKFEGFVDDIYKEDIEDYVDQSTFYNAFALTSLIDKGDRMALNNLKRCIFTAKDLKGELIRMCGLLQQSYRVAFKAALCPKGADVKKELGVKRMPRRLSLSVAEQGVKLCADTVNLLKTGGDARSQFSLLLENLMNLA